MLRLSVSLPRHQTETKITCPVQANYDFVSMRQIALDEDSLDEDLVLPSSACHALGHCGTTAVGVRWPSVRAEWQLQGSVWLLIL